MLDSIFMNGLKEEIQAELKLYEIQVEEVTTSTNVKTTASSTRLESGLNYTSNLGDPFDFKHGIEISVEKGTTSTNSKAITSSGPIVTSEHNRTSQTPMNEQTMDQQSPLEETDATATVTSSPVKKVIHNFSSAFYEYAANIITFVWYAISWRIQCLKKL
ncbi:uncharacterized protein LOC131619370 [Vicia villosa]|uniref:uncharacterized protein LOC131619370 n=1 Tax=Vicia villosa TaxID=3911 RepID=UPI00273B9915|nr:uncharacterized protein LOC131619370 [Vicia villosa]